MFKYIYNFITGIIKENKITDSALWIFIITGIALFLKASIEFIQFLFLKRVFDFHYINTAFLQYQNNFFENIIYYSLFVFLFSGLYFIKRKIILTLKTEVFKEVNIPFYYSSLLNIIIALPVILFIIYGILLLFKVVFPTFSILSKLPYLNFKAVLTISIILLFFLTLILIAQVIYLRRTNSKEEILFKKLIFFIVKTHFFIFLYNSIKVGLNFLFLFILLVISLPLVDPGSTLSNNLIFIFLSINFLLNYIFWMRSLEKYLDISILSKNNILFLSTLLKHIKNNFKMEYIKVIKVSKCTENELKYNFKTNFTYSNAKILYKNNDNISFYKKIKFSIYFKKNNKNNAPSHEKKLKTIVSIIGIITIFIIAGILFVSNGYQHGYLKIYYQNKKYLIISHYNDFFITKEYRLDSRDNYLISTEYKLINKYDQNIQFLQTITIPQNQFKIELKSIDNITNVNKIVLNAIKEK